VHLCCIVTVIPPVARPTFSGTNATDRLHVVAEVRYPVASILEPLQLSAFLLNGPDTATDTIVAATSDLPRSTTRAGAPSLPTSTSASM
jgi:hypothetical protein